MLEWFLLTYDITSTQKYILFIKIKQKWRQLTQVLICSDLNLNLVCTHKNFMQTSDLNKV